MKYNKQSTDEAVAKLVPGEALLTSIKAVKGGKIQLEIAEKIQSKSGGVINMLSVMNADDERFSANNGARRAWLNSSAALATEHLGIDAEVIAGLEIGGDVAYVCIKNPNVNGAYLRVQVKETTEGDDYDMKHVESKAKRAGADGPILTFGGDPIFSKTEVIGSTDGVVPHTFITSDEERATADGVVNAESSAPELG